MYRRRENREAVCPSLRFAGLRRRKLLSFCISFLFLSPSLSFSLFNFPLTVFQSLSLSLSLSFFSLRRLSFPFFCLFAAALCVLPPLSFILSVFPLPIVCPISLFPSCPPPDRRPGSFQRFFFDGAGGRLSSFAIALFASSVPLMSDVPLLLLLFLPYLLAVHCC